jgi:hypothetical protein
MPPRDFAKERLGGPLFPEFLVNIADEVSCVVPSTWSFAPKYVDEVDVPTQSLPLESMVILVVPSSCANANELAPGEPIQKPAAPELVNFS